MYFHRELYREAISNTLNNTYVLELPKNGLLSSIMIYAYGTQATAQGQEGGKWKISDYISKIEVIADGSKVLKSFSGRQCQALSFLDQGVTMPDMMRNYATNSQRAYFLINFGRFVKDLDYGLNLSNYKSVELKITNDMTSTYFSDLYTTIQCTYAKDALESQFKGFMQTELWREWVPVASEVKYLELPTNYKIRRILLNPRPGFNGTTEEWNDTLNNLMYNIDLTFKTGSDRVFKDSFQQLMIDNYLELGKYNIAGALTYLSADHAVDIGLGYHIAVATAAATKDGAVAAGVPTINADVSSNLPKVEAYEADTCIYMLGLGLGYQQTAFFNFDENSDPSTWLNTADKDTVKLDITTRSTATVTSAKNSVLIDRLVS